MSEVLDNKIAELTNDYFESFRAATEGFCSTFTDNDDRNVWIEGFRQSMRMAVNAHLCHTEADPAYPLLIKQNSLQRQIGLPSPDCVYLWASLHGDYTYRLRGNRGSAHLFQVAINAGSSANYPDFPVVFDRDSFEEPLYAADAELDLVLSAKPHPELGARWIPLPEGPCEFYIRQYYYDWNSEKPASLVLEREDLCYPPPPIDEREISDRIARANKFLRVWGSTTRQFVQSYLSVEEGQIPPVSIPGAFEGTKYLNGHFRCEPDQAIIMELDEPQAPYWSFQLSNLAWEGLDYYLRQTSINGHQATLDSDGKFRAVISHRDPGVPNWLDTGGRTLGLISGRYFKAETSPTPALKKVPFDVLKDHLPADTKTISTSERQDVLRQGLHSAHARRASDL